MNKKENDEVINLSEDPEESERRLLEYIENGDYANRSGYKNFVEKEKRSYGSIILLLLLAIGGGVWYYQDLLFPKEIIPPRSAAVLFPKVWEKEPPAWDVYMACENAMDTISFSDRMWIASDAVCNSKGLTVTYKRDGSASYLYPPEKSVRDKKNINIARRTIPITGLQKRKSEKLTVQEKTYLNLLEFFRIMNTYGARASINLEKQESKKDGDPPRNVVAPFVKISYKISTSTFPMEIYNYVAKIPGTTLDSLKIKISGSQFTWNFSGKIYCTLK